MNLTEKQEVSGEVIEQFLAGSNPMKYVVAIEPTYHTNKVDLIINDPERGKYIRKHDYHAFLWMKHDITTKMYGGKRMDIINACKKYDVKITKVRNSASDGSIPKRLENGYVYLVKCKVSYNGLVNFFKEGGIDIYGAEYKKSFVMFSPVEQFMIQTGIRLFKGVDNYTDVHRFQFDLETEGLDPKKDAIFQIGVRDNRGLEGIFEVTGNTPKEKRESEKEAIIKFFQLLDVIRPDIITGYNTENFDWDYFYTRCERLCIPITEVAITLNPAAKIKRKEATLKLGNESESFMQTFLWGTNNIDIAHAVRRAQAINSDIKSWSLKYITKYAGIAKPNRVYVPGDKINSTWADTTNNYAFNEKNGDWYKITPDNPFVREGYELVKGSLIVQRYLLDDLWETEQIDTKYNQAAFLIAKLLPTSYMRSSTMGTASQWKLLMSAWSYENGLAIPETEPKRDFTGGLSRLLQVGYAKNVVKLDFAALYPKIELTHDIFPDLDISGVMKGLLTYIVDTRDKFKFLTEEHKNKTKKLEKELEANLDNYTKEQIEELKNQIKENKTLASSYDVKQLPLKILANSWFGSYGAPYIFNWGDSDSAEETTCRGRQYLRLMVKHFTEKYGFVGLVGDSVTYDTPIYLRNKINNTIDILPICDLFNEKSEFIDIEGLRDYEEKPFEVLTRNGWKNIKYVYRHETNKKIHRITTKDRLLNVTEDHSLFQNGVEVRPSDLKRNDPIDTYEIPFNTDLNTHINEDQAFLYGFFLGDGSSTCSYRKYKYKSRKTGEIKYYNCKRSDWKISNSRLEFLEKLKNILKNDFNQNGLIKNHLESSGVYNLVVHNAKFNKLFCEEFYTSYREKKVPNFILNSNPKIKRAFIEGVFASDGYGDTIETCSSIGMKSQIAMSGISLLLKELNIGYKIETRKDKQKFITFSLKNRYPNNMSEFTKQTKKESNKVWRNDIIDNKDKNKYVYDISTDDGTFVCGINGIIAHNTDGFNFAFPGDIDSIKYTAKGSHWKTIDNANKELTGLDAVLAEFNENYMEGRMGLDIDDICNSTINFSRKNYANDISGKVKLVGNSIKSKKMPVYIEDFLAKGIRLLLDGKGYEFIQYYNEYVDKIYNYQIPLVKIASKSKVRSSIEDYKKKATQKNKAGNPMPKQAHMELALRAGLQMNLGDVIYYVNTGKSKSVGDLKSIKSKENGSVTLEINCKLIDTEMVERDNELIKELEILKKTLTEDITEEKKNSINKRISEIDASLVTDEYNAAKYLTAFNKKVKPLIVCFSKEIRKDILLDVIKEKNKETKTTIEKLKERQFFTQAQCELVSGQPEEEDDQDRYFEDLMLMEDKEIKFWSKVGMTPNNMDEEEWINLKKDYEIRMENARIEGIQNEKDKLDEIFKRLEISDLLDVEKKGILPIKVLTIVSMNDVGDLVSRKWNTTLYHLNDVFKYELEAQKRNEYYTQNNITSDDKYDKYLTYKAEVLIMTGDSINAVTVKENIQEVIPLVIEKLPTIVIPKEEIKAKTKKTDEDEEDDEEELEENEILIDDNELNPEKPY